MNTISKFGLAAVLALGVSGAAMAQDADVGLDAGADVEIGADTGLGDVNTDLGVDAMATGSIANQDSLATSVSTASSFDLSGYSDSTNVNCVAVSTLEGGAQGSAQTIGDAAIGNSAIMSLHSDIEANADLKSQLEANCQVAEFDVNDIVYVETGADGSLTFYYDDRA